MSDWPPFPTEPRFEPEYVWCCQSCGLRHDHHLAAPGLDEDWRDPCDCGGTIGPTLYLAAYEIATPTLREKWLEWAWKPSVRLVTSVADTPPSQRGEKNL